MTETILIVDDEPDIVRALDYSLRREGFHTRLAYDGRTALQLAQGDPRPALVLLDLTLPDISGGEVCRRLRAEAATRDLPVVMLTARGEELDRVLGFEAGADDYVVKPYSTRELVLRLRAVLRRGRSPSDDAAATLAPLEHGALRIDRQGHRVVVGERELHLTAIEFRLLVTLIERAGRVQSREQLLADVWNYAPDVTTRTVDTHVKRLRQKLEDAAPLVESVRGVGYCVRATAQGAPDKAP